MNRHTILVPMLLVFALSACVQSRTMPTHRGSDSRMGCAETAQRLGELDAIKKLVLSEKNSKNILAGFLFFPAISGNQNNVQDTINAVNQRQQVLGDIYQTNECVSEIPVYSVAQIKQKIDSNQVLELQTNI